MHRRTRLPQTWLSVHFYCLSPVPCLFFRYQMYRQIRHIIDRLNRYAVLPYIEPVSNAEALCRVPALVGKIYQIAQYRLHHGISLYVGVILVSVKREICQHRQQPNGCPLGVLLDYEPCHYACPPFFCIAQIARFTRRKSHSQSSAIRLMVFASDMPFTTQTAAISSVFTTCNSTNLRPMRL